MSDNENQAAEDQRVFAIQRLYVKDLSFEAPNTPAAFTQEWKPQMSVNLNTSATHIGTDTFEMILTVSVEAKLEDKTAYLVEVQQAGIMVIKGFSEEELRPLLGIGGPNMLFPYAREVVSDLVTRGSFPQFVLQPVNFEAMYRQQLAEQQAQEGNGDGQATH